MELLSHMGYHGSIEVSVADKVLHGKILFIEDLVTYEAENVSQLQTEFEAAVEDYLETCTAIGKTPQKACSGQFNVRVPPELHRRAQIRAAVDATNLNAVTTRALEEYLDETAQSSPSAIYSANKMLYEISSNATLVKSFLSLDKPTSTAFIGATNVGTTSTFNIEVVRPADQEYAH